MVDRSIEVLIVGAGADDPDDHWEDTATAGADFCDERQVSGFVSRSALSLGTTRLAVVIPASRVSQQPSLVRLVARTRLEVSHMERVTSAALAEVLADRKTMVLTTFKMDGTPVPTPVSVAVENGRIFFRSYAETWKAKRMRRNPCVEVTPSTLRGKGRGPTLSAQAHLMSGKDEGVARRALARRHPFLQGVLVPLTHRVLRYHTLHYEITPGD